MGKPKEELNRPAGEEGGDAAAAAANSSDLGVECSWVCRFFGLRCLLFLLLGVSVFLSGLFWLPPFSHSDPDDYDSDPRFRGHEIVASFKLKKSISSLQDNTPQLISDIFEELPYPGTKVVILYLESSPKVKSNVTNVVFGVDRERKSTPITSAVKSLIRSSFVSLVTNQTSLQLTTSLFGKPYMFEVLKFPGGITISPPQKAFLLQQVQVFFNFSLTFSIQQVEENFDELRSQLKSGLHLSSYENLYISLTNSRGSTVSPPVTVQTSVLLAVGITSSTPRVKQLAQTISGSHARNLGLNHTVFGKVKQVSLSSILKHSLHGGNDGSSWAPVPAPSAYPHSQYPHPHPHQHHHHHHHHHQDHDSHLGPVSSPSTSPSKRPPKPIKSSATPAPAPAPVKSFHSRSHGCWFGFGRRHKWPVPKQYVPVPAAAPRISPYHRYATLPPPPAVSPAPRFAQRPPSFLPHVVLAHRPPSSASESESEPPDNVSSMAPSPVPSVAGLLPSAHWRFPLLIALLLML